ncbi:hypothetical protein WA026_019592 [Henosepilachna vigintioctopunctata]|uniref:Uncharacterized protein n=1 Tax=Henosepilachna vigintioctopunctata TaxID=420089 RepID=A0AAW1TWL7_9CUCU
MWHRVLLENINITWVCDLCLDNMNLAIDRGSSHEINQTILLDKDVKSLSKENMLLQKLLQEMEYTIGIQKKMICSLEYQLQTNKTENYVGKRFDTVETPVADKDNNIPTADPVNKQPVRDVHKQYFTKAEMNVKINPNGREDPKTIVHRSGFSARHSVSENVLNSGNGNKITVDDVNKAIISAQQSCSLTEQSDSNKVNSLGNSSWKEVVNKKGSKSARARH